MRVSVVSEHLLPAEMVAAALRREQELEVTSVVGGYGSLEGPAGIRALQEPVLVFAPLVPPEVGLLRRVIEGIAATRARVLVIVDLWGCFGLVRALQVGARGYVGPWEREEVVAARVL